MCSRPRQETCGNSFGASWSSNGFIASARNRHFLEYVVEETLAGRADRIKAYSVATAVFGRGPDFNPDLDSIVRIEAGRLRRALDHYYLTVGGSDGLRIAIPKGTYVPAFGPANSNQLPTATLLSASTTPLSSQNRGLAIFVMPFEEEGDQSAFPNFTRGFTRLLIVGLMRFTGLTVFGSGPILACGNVNKTEKLATDVDVDFILSGGTTISATRFNVEALLTEAWNGRCVWAESFERTLAPAQIVSTRDEVAGCIVRSLARPCGVVASNLTLGTTVRSQRP